MKLKYKIGIAFAAILMTAVIVIRYGNPPPDVNAGTLVRSVNVFGTATTSPGSFHFGNTTGTTSSSVIQLDSSVDTVSFEVYPESASSTAAFSMQVMGSTLDKCSASAGNNQSWVDAIGSNTVSSGVTTINNGTSTVIGVIGAVARGKTYTMTNVNFRCMKVWVQGHGTNLYVKANLKTLSF